MVHRGHAVLAMDCVLAGAEAHRGRPLNWVVRQLFAMFWLFGGSIHTVAGFAVGAILGAILALVSGMDSGAAIVLAMFGGLGGETLHHFLRGNDRDRLDSE